MTRSGVISHDPAFAVGDRVAFFNGIGYEPEWYFGQVREVATRPSVHVYRIRWEDGFEDKVGSPEEWYTEGELRAASEVEANA